MADPMAILKQLTGAPEDDPRIRALLNMRGSDQMLEPDASLGGYTPRTVLSERMLGRIGNEETGPYGPKGFTPDYRPGQELPHGQRQAEYFRRYVGDTPTTDSEVEMVYNAPSFTNSDQYTIGSTPSKEPPATTEEELEDIHQQMDRDVTGKGMPNYEAPPDAIEALRNDPEAEYDEFVEQFGWEAVPDDIKQMKPEWMQPPL
jgi:hypothetical protein